MEKKMGKKMETDNKDPPYIQMRTMLFFHTMRLSIKYIWDNREQRRKDEER
jgi:hypothetical protein